MATARIARPKATTGAAGSVSESDLKNPDDSRVGFYLGEVAAHLTLLEDLHYDALELDYSNIGKAMGRTRKDVAYALTANAIEQAGHQNVPDEETS